MDWVVEVDKGILIPELPRLPSQELNSVLSMVYLLTDMQII